MVRSRIPLFAALFVVLIGASAGIVWLKNKSQSQELTVEIPADNWVNILFDAEGLASKSINEITSDARLARLSTIQLPAGDLEVRIWVGFGLHGVDGLVLRRSSHQWSAIHLHGMAEAPPFPSTTELLATPKSGWDGAWKKLTDAGIVVLPDASETGCRTYGKDGTLYVVEININREYRTYMYDNPHYAPCDDAKRMIRIGEIISEEFDLAEFRVAN